MTCHSGVRYSTLTKRDGLDGGRHYSAILHGEKTFRIIIIIYQIERVHRLALETHEAGSLKMLLGTCLLLSIIALGKHGLYPLNHNYIQTEMNKYLLIGLNIGYVEGPPLDQICMIIVGLCDEWCEVLNWRRWCNLADFT